MAKTIAIANQKGGVGKTTTSINLGASLAVLEKRTLIIDADPQANATSGLGFDPREIENSIYECVVNEIDIDKAVINTDINGLDILPSHIDLVGAEIEMLNFENRERIFEKAIQNISDNYDYVLIDCSPSLGLLTLNALTAADSVIIPVQCEYFALEGLGKLLNTVKMIQNGLNPELQIEGFLLTMYDARLKLSNLVVEEVQRHFQDLVFKTIIQRNVRLTEAPSHGKPVITYDAKSTGAINYLNLAQELVKNNEEVDEENQEEE